MEYAHRWMAFLHLDFLCLQRYVRDGYSSEGICKLNHIAVKVLSLYLQLLTQAI